MNFMDVTSMNEKYGEEKHINAIYSKKSQAFKHNLCCTGAAYGFLKDNGINVPYFTNRYRIRELKTELSVIHLKIHIWKNVNEKTNCKLPEFYLGDVEKIKALNISNLEEFNKIRVLSIKVFDLLVEYFDNIQMILLSIDISFSKDSKGDIYLTSDIIPETIKVLNKNTGEKFAKTRKIYDRLFKGYYKTNIDERKI